MESVLHVKWTTPTQSMPLEIFSSYKCKELKYFGIIMKTYTKLNKDTQKNTIVLKRHLVGKWSVAVENYCWEKFGLQVPVHIQYMLNTVCWNLLSLP